MRINQPEAVNDNGPDYPFRGTATAFIGFQKKALLARPVEELDDDTLRAIDSSAVPEEFAHLDDLIKDWTPRSGPVAAFCKPMCAGSLPRHSARNDRLNLYDQDARRESP